jgi:hypothetical protein
MIQEGKKAAAMAGALGFYTCMYARKFEQVSSGAAKLTIADCMKQAGVAAWDGLQIGALAVVAPTLVTVLVAHGAYEGAKNINEAIKENELDKQSAIDEQDALNCGSEQVNTTAINTFWGACDFKAALRLAQLLRSRPPEPSWLNTIMPNLEKGARAQATVEPILAAVAKTSDPARKKALLDQARAAADGVPCLMDKIGKAAAPPPAPQAACEPDGKPVEQTVWEMCGPEQGTGRLVCYGDSPHCKNGDVISAWTKLSNDDYCKKSGGVWKSSSQSMLCGDVSKPETCAPAKCTAPGANERAWKCTAMAPSCGALPKVAGLQSAVLPAPRAAPSPPDNAPNNTPMGGLGPPPDPQPGNTPMGGLGPPPAPAGSAAPTPQGATPQSSTQQGSTPQGPMVIPVPVPPPRVGNAPPPNVCQPKRTPPPNVCQPKPASGTNAGTSPGTKIGDTWDTLPKPADTKTQPAGTATMNSGTCQFDQKTGIRTCTDTRGRTCTTKESFCDPAKTVQAAPPPPSGPLKLKQQPGTQVAKLDEAKPQAAPAAAIAACESKAPYLPWGGQGTASITVSGGKPCGVGWHDTGATILENISVSSPPAHGTVTPKSKNEVIFTPTAGYKGQDSFMLRMQERNGGRRATLTVRVTVTIR